MNKFLAALVTGLILISSPAMTAPEAFKTDMINPVFSLNGQACTATVFESRRDEDGLVTTKLLTAQHCVSGKSVGRVDMNSYDEDLNMTEERRVIYDVKKQNRGYDLAVIQLRDTTNLYPVAKIADKIKVELGDPTWVVGYPLGGKKTMTTGLFGGVQRFPIGQIDATKKYLRSTAQISPGNSGGPLFQFNKATLDYEIIGVTSMGIPQIAHVGLYVTLDKVQVITGMKSAPVQHIVIPYFFEGP